MNEYGEAAEPVRVLAQALDASDAVVGQKIAWVLDGVGGSERGMSRGGGTDRTVFADRRGP